MAEKKTRPGRSDPEKLGFEAAARELEAIIGRIESGEVDLEASLEEYERGVKLVRRCRAILERAEQRVDELALDESSGEGPES